MGFWEEFCVVCGGPPRWPSPTDGEYQQTRPASTHVSTEWLNDWCGVTPEQPDVPIDIGHYDSSGCFECGCLSASCTEPDSSHLNANGAGDKFATFGPWLFDIKPHEQQASKKPAIGTDSSSSSSSPTDARMTAAGLHKCGGEWVRYGVAFHRACGQVLQQRLGYAIDFNHIWPLLEQQNEELPDSGCVNYFISISYDGTDKYHGQEFEPWLDTEDEYLLLDPRHCRQNADRIVRVWEPLVQKFRGHQPGTAAAAAQAGSAAPAVQASAASLEVSKVDNTTQAVLKLLFSTAGDQQQQLQLAGLLLPLCRSMPQVLAGQMQLCVAANTMNRAVAASAWLAKHGVLVSLLQLEVCVDCCQQDMQAANAAVGPALAAAASNQGFKLASYKGTCSSSAELEQLLQHLPLTHLTHLSISSTCSLTPAAASALTAATALQELSIPGAGFAANLAAVGGSPGGTSLAAVLAVSLQRLGLTDAGSCSHHDLATVAQQLTALTALCLRYEAPPGAPAALGPAFSQSQDQADGWTVCPEVCQSWSVLPTRSLQLGTRRLPVLLDDYDTCMCLDSCLLNDLSRLTSLTRLFLGPSTTVPEEFKVSQLVSTLQHLTSLQDLSLTLYSLMWDVDGDTPRLSSARAAMVSACAALPDLRRLMLNHHYCSGHLAQLSAATKLTYLELECQKMEKDDSAALTSLQQELPELVVRTTRI